MNATTAKLILTKPEHRQLSDAIERVWQAIGADVMDYAGEDVCNEDAIGSCLEHLHTYGDDDDARKLYQSLIRTHSFGVVRDYFCDTIKLN